MTHSTFQISSYHFCFIIQAIVTVFFDAATFFDINALLNITGIIEELKILLAMIALIYLKFNRPDLKGTIQVINVDLQIYSILFIFKFLHFQ